jgi:hypothetical protein
MEVFGWITNKAFEANLKLLGNALARARLPKFFYEMKLYIEVMVLGYKKIHVYKHNYVLFWKDYEKNRCMLRM